MRPLIAVVVLAAFLTSSGQGKRDDGSHVVLPSAELIGCSSSRCSQLWQEDSSPRANAIYPKQVSIDIRNSCPAGIVARYDGNVPIEEIKAAIDKHYGKWAEAKNEAATVPVKLWRVEPEKFAIQLVTVDKDMEGMTLGQALAQPLGQQKEKNSKEEVAKRVIYLAFPEKKCTTSNGSDE